MIKNVSTTRPQLMVAILILTGILSVGTGLTQLEPATAGFGESPSAERELAKAKPGRRPNRQNSSTPVTNLPKNLPNSVSKAVLQAAKTQLNLPSSQLSLVQAEQKTWNDGCLGLGGPAESCLLTLVPGWQVTVSADDQRLVYRTDQSGSVVKLDEAASRIGKDNNLPSVIADAVLQNASQLMNLSASELKIVQAEKREWPDGCLGLSKPDVMCSMAIVPGWQVTVQGQEKRLVYRTSETGVVKLDKAASQISEANVFQPIWMTPDQLPAPIKGEVVFRAISTGGFAGQTTQITLMKNGQLSRALITPNGVVANPVVLRVSPQQVQKFQQLLEKQKLLQFNQLSYPAPKGSADYITVTLTSKAGTTQYADMVQDRLPQPLQTVIQSWNQLISGPQTSSAY